jgi:hypothetical protein
LVESFGTGARLKNEDSEDKIMKRLSLIGGIAALLFLAPGIASAQGGHGGGSHGGGAAFHSGGRTYVAAGHAGRVAPRGGYAVAPHRGYSVAPYGGGWRVHPYSAVGVGIRPSPRHVWVPGYWGSHGGARVWIGGAWLLPQTDWTWMAPHWQWTGYTWVWQQGYWAPPY